LLKKDNYKQNYNKLEKLLHK